MVNQRHVLLVVDDDVKVRTSLFDLLKKQYQVLTASGGAEALELLAQREVHVILSDYRIRGMSGAQFLAQAGLLYPDITRILFSGYGDIKAVIRAVDEGHVFRYILKPWDPNEFVTLVRQAVEIYDLRSERRRLLTERDEGRRSDEANGPSPTAGRVCGLGPGDRLGDFRIEERLGAGGMGVVFRAFDTRLDRVVALKLLGPALDSEADVARFHREAQAVAKLKHPGIASVYSVGQEAGLRYMAIEYIDGATIKSVISAIASARGPHRGADSVLREALPGETRAEAAVFDGSTETFTPRADAEGATDYERGGPSLPQLVATPEHVHRCCEMIRDAALALDHAHGRNVIHRDIKPANLLLDRRGLVHIIDFGLARFFEDLTVTGTGQLVGTPLYMSPEQVDGRDVDHRTDIYSLGLVLYELLGLRRPFASASREALLRQIATEAMSPITRHNRAVPADLESVVHKATAKDPDARYQSASDFASDLQNCLERRPVCAAPYRYGDAGPDAAGDRPDGLGNEETRDRINKLVSAASILSVILLLLWLLVSHFR